MSRIVYTIGGLDLASLGIVVKSADGLLDQPTPRERTSQAWPDMNGAMVGTAAPTFDVRTMELSCSMWCESLTDFVSKTQALSKLFRVGGLLPMRVSYESTELYYLVYLNDALNFERNWVSGGILSTFSIRLSEPEPFKRVYRVDNSQGTPVLTITKTASPVGVWWGDSSIVEDAGVGTVSHAYSDGESSHIVILTGDIDNLECSLTYSELVWNLL